MLHLVVREHLEGFLRTVREERGAPLPRYVEQELRRYLPCGVLAHGFARVACSRCGEEILVGFSCKCRGVCPSCAARRMCGTAAHLCDHVLPKTRLRQWVLTVPSEVRRILALNAEALSACNRIFTTELARWQKEVSGHGKAAQTGSVTFVQRFHSTLGSFVHFHLVAPDGVFTRDGTGALVFTEGRWPSRADLEGIAGRIATRVQRWLRRRGLLDERKEEERSNEAPELSPLEACLQLSLFSGEYLRLADGVPVLVNASPRGRAKASAGEVEGFNLHADVTVRADDAEGRERLCRYCARPPFSLERLSRLLDGRVAYLLRAPKRNGATHLVMTPQQFLARIAALVPPPRFPLTRFAGVFAPSSPWRKDVVAFPGAPVPRPSSAKRTKSSNAVAAIPASPPSSDGPEAQAPSLPRSALGNGLLDPCGARIDWASLLRRIYFEDVLACPCGGRRRIVADVTDPGTVAHILDHLGLPSVALPVAKARDPTLFD